MENNRRMWTKATVRDSSPQWDRWWRCQDVVMHLTVRRGRGGRSISDNKTLIRQQCPIMWRCKSMASTIDVLNPTRLIVCKIVLLTKGHLSVTIMLWNQCSYRRLASRYRRRSDKRQLMSHRCVDYRTAVRSHLSGSCRLVWNRTEVIGSMACLYERIRLSGWTLTFHSRTHISLPN